MEKRKQEVGALITEGGKGKKKQKTNLLFWNCFALSFERKGEIG